MEDFTALLKDKKPNLSEMSVKIYNSCWSSLKKLFERKDNEIDFLLNPKAVIKTLEENYSKLNSIKLKLACVVVILKMLDETKYADEIKEYSNYIDSIASKINRETSMNKKTDKQKENWTTDEEQKVIEEHLLSKIPKNFIIKTNDQMIAFRNYILFILQNYLGTRNDLADAKIMYRPKNIEPLKEDKEHNFILLDRKSKKVSYLMNNYKTEKTMGSIESDINPEYYTVLTKYLKNILEFNTDGYLMLNDNMKTKMTNNRLGVIYSGLAEGSGVEKKLSTTLTRHINASKNMKAYEEIKKQAQQMGHSLATHIEYMKK